MGLSKPSAAGGVIASFGKLTSARRQYPPIEKRTKLVTRQERIDDFIHEGRPPIDQPLQILCEDHNGTYVILFLCRWREGGNRDFLAGPWLDQARGPLARMANLLDGRECGRQRRGQWAGYLGGGVQWRSGGVEHPHDTPPYPLTPSPTSAHNSMANLVYNIKRFIFLRKIAVA